MNKNLLILFCLFSLMQVSRAQDPIFGEPQHSTLSADSLSDVVGLIPESLDANVDSLLHSWHVQYFSKVDEYCHDDAENVYFPDSVYEERLERLPSVIRLPYNEVVRDCIDLYAGRKRDLVRYMLGMADFYFPIIEQVLDKHNLPLELKYLAVVESALNPVALSRVGACGLWQFMLPTGKIYGLEINSLLDERRDPEKAAEAVSHLKEESGRKDGEINRLWQRILTMQADVYPQGQKALTVFEQGMTPVLVRQFANLLLEQEKGETVLVCSGDDASGYNYTAGSLGRDMRAFGKELNARLQGRGGGSTQMVQGTFRASREEIEKVFQELARIEA